MERLPNDRLAEAISELHSLDATMEKLADTRVIIARMIADIIIDRAKTTSEYVVIHNVRCDENHHCHYEVSYPKWMPAPNKRVAGD